MALPPMQGFRIQSELVPLNPAEGDFIKSLKCTSFSTCGKIVMLLRSLEGELLIRDWMGVGMDSH
jgi:hypothetical protein